MPWNTHDEQTQRWRFIREWLRHKTTLVELCRRYRITRKTAYKWIARFEEHGRAGLVNSRRAAGRVHNRPSELWLARIRRWRAKHPSWGAPKLHWALRRRFGRKGLPSEAAISRWLMVWGLSRPKLTKRRGPRIARAALTVPPRPNVVWTVDFKGWFRTGDGTRVEPLTVRDLFSRFLLAIVLLRRIDLQLVQRWFRTLFRQYGVPDVIRVDNGNPFGSSGPRGLTRLSVWWIKLGIRVEFIAPGCPGQNGAHEQMHKVYKAETLNPPAATLSGQQRRTTAWVHIYNHERPHEALQMRRPADVYRRSPKPMPAKLQPWRYPAGYLSRLVRGKGSIHLHGKIRFIGEAFEGERIGLTWMNAQTWHVYLGPLLIGELDAAAANGIRGCRYTATAQPPAT